MNVITGNQATKKCKNEDTTTRRTHEEEHQRASSWFRVFVAKDVASGQCSVSEHAVTVMNSWSGHLARDNRFPGGAYHGDPAGLGMKILGISAHYHDSAAALVIDGVPVGAVQEERL